MQSYMATDASWKYLYCEANGLEELYNLREDPKECRNLISEGESLDQASRLRETIVRWCAENGDDGMLENGGLKRSEMDVEKKYEGEKCRIT